MPNRILREGILTSERIAMLNWAEEVFYRRLMSVVDDFGRFTANPKLIRAACYPLLVDRVSDADIGKWLAKCAEAALVSVYPASDGKRYVQVHSFNQQKRAEKSKYPPPPSGCVADATHPPSSSEASAHLDVFVFEDVDVDEDGVVKGRASAPDTFVLPDWINQEHWDTWHSGPKKRKANGRQKQMAVDKLAKWRDAGQDHAGALENAALGGYQGLFLPDKKPVHGSTSGGETAYQRSMRERVQRFAPSAAAQPPPAQSFQPPNRETIDVIATSVD